MNKKTTSTWEIRMFIRLVGSFAILACSDVYKTSTQSWYTTKMGHGSAFMLLICAALMHCVFAQSSICSTQMLSNPGNVITYGEGFGVVSGCQLYVLDATFHMKTPITLPEFKRMHQANFELAMIQYFGQSHASPPTIHDLRTRLQLSSISVSITTIIIDFALHSPNRMYGTIDAQKVNMYLANLSVPVGAFIAIDDSTGIQENVIILGTAGIISASVGGLCLIAIIVGIVYCCRQCNKSGHSDTSETSKHHKETGKHHEETGKYSEENDQPYERHPLRPDAGKEENVED